MSHVPHIERALNGMSKNVNTHNRYKFDSSNFFFGDILFSYFLYRDQETANGSAISFSDILNAVWYAKHREKWENTVSFLSFCVVVVVVFLVNLFLVVHFYVILLGRSNLFSQKAIFSMKSEFTQRYVIQMSLMKKDHTMIIRSLFFSLSIFVCIKCVRVWI